MIAASCTCCISAGSLQADVDVSMPWLRQWWQAIITHEVGGAL
jgi:hypothetical protein